MPLSKCFIPGPYYLPEVAVDHPPGYSGTSYRSKKEGGKWQNLLISHANMRQRDSCETTLQQKQPPHLQNTTYSLQHWQSELWAMKADAAMSFWIYKIFCFSVLPKETVRSYLYLTKRTLPLKSSYHKSNLCLYSATGFEFSCSTAKQYSYPLNSRSFKIPIVLLVFFASASHWLFILKLQSTYTLRSCSTQKCIPHLVSMFLIYVTHM